MLDLGIVDRARRAWSRFVEQPVEAALDKAPTPLADGCTVTRSRAATDLLLRPAAQPNTMRARNAKACAVLRRCV